MVPIVVMGPVMSVTTLIVTVTGNHEGRDRQGLARGREKWSVFPVDSNARFDNRLDELSFDVTSDTKLVKNILGNWCQFWMLWRILICMCPHIVMDTIHEQNTIRIRIWLFHVCSCLKKRDCIVTQLLKKCRCRRSLPRQSKNNFPSVIFLLEIFNWCFVRLLYTATQSSVGKSDSHFLLKAEEYLLNLRCFWYKEKFK